MKTEIHKSLYTNELCALCGNKAPEVRWPAPPCPYAHRTCLEKIQDIDNELYALIRVQARNSVQAHLAHYKAIKAIKKELGDISIFDYVNQQGKEKLREIFQSKVLPDISSKL